MKDCTVEWISAFEPEEIKAKLEQLVAQARSGEVTCFRGRIYKTDGTSEDIVGAGTEEENALALTVLRRMFEKAH